MVSSFFLAIIYSLCRRRSPPFHFLCSPSPSSILADAHHLHRSSSARIECVVSFATSLRSTLTRSRRPMSSESSASRFLPRGRPSWPSSSPPLWPAYSGCSRYCLSLVLRLPLCRDARKQAGCSYYPQDTSERSLPPCPPLQVTGARGQPFTGHLRQQFVHTRVCTGPCLLQHISLTAYECQPAGNQASPTFSVLQNRDQGLRLRIWE